MTFKITSQKISLLVLAILLFAVFWRFSGLLYFPDSSIILEKGLSVKIQPGESQEQKFTAKRNGLAKIETLLRSPGIKFENGDQMDVMLLDEKCEKTLAKGELRESSLNSENLHEFVFDRVPDSAEKYFCLKLTFRPKKDTARAIQIFTMGENPGEPLSIRPAYKNESVFEDLSELNQRISQYKPWFFKHYYLYFIVFGFFALSFALIFHLTR